MPPGQFPPGLLPPWIIAPGQLPPRTIAIEENCPPDDFSLYNNPRINAPRIIGPRTIAPKIIDPGQFPPGKLAPKKIAFWMICHLHNFLSDNWPRGKLHPRKIVPRMNYTRDIFSRRIRKCRTLIDSSFFLFFLGGV